MAEYDSKTWTGDTERPSLMQLIDRYVPRHTREEVIEMSLRHEERITALLLTIHEYRMRNQQMAERMDAMEKEFYSQVRIPVSLGSFTASAEVTPHDMARTYSVKWYPDRFAMHCRISDADVFRLSPELTPHLFEMVGRQFEEHAKRELLPKLRTEYLKLYAHFKL